VREWILVAVLCLALGCSGTGPRSSQDGLASSSPRVSLCSGGRVLVFAGRNSSAENAVVAVSAREIVETSQPDGVDYGTAEGAEPGEAWFVDENGVRSVDHLGRMRALMMERAVLCDDMTILHRSTLSATAVAVADGAGQFEVAFGPGGRISSATLLDVQTHFVNIISWRSMTDGPEVPAEWAIDGRSVSATSTTLKNADFDLRKLVTWSSRARVLPGEAPLQTRNGRFFVVGRANNTAIMCMIDTGSDRFAVSSDLAQFIPGTVSSIKLGTAKGTLQVSRGRLDVLAISGLTFARPVVVVNPTFPPHTATCGRDYLSSMAVTLDFVHKEVSISQTKGAKCFVGCVPITTWQVALGAVDIGGRPFEAMFDTGYVGSVRLPPSSLGGVRTARLAPSSAALTNGAGNTCGPYGTLLTDISLGGQTVQAQLCPQVSDSGFPVAIGAETFARFRKVTIDYPDSFIQFTK
jgi:hypothetical protein